MMFCIGSFVSSGHSVRKLVMEATVFLATCLSAQAVERDWFLQTLYQFPTNNRPWQAFTSGTDGHLYGISTEFPRIRTSYVYRFEPPATIVPVAELSGDSVGSPSSTLIQGKDGNLYGVADFDATGNGTVFKVSLSGNVTVLHRFAGPDGARPWGKLLQASDGHLYGTTTSGGAGGLGTVFRITANGDFDLLYSFPSNGTDGQQPLGYLVEAPDHSIFGNTSLRATIFRLSPDRAFTTLLHLDRQTGDGFTRFLLASDGFFYGTTRQGGAHDYGTIFRMNSDGALTTLFAFDGSNGAFPNPLIERRDGSFYGTTAAGGKSGMGTVYRLTKSAAFAQLHSFSGGDGNGPIGELAEGADGNLYGVTRSGGTGNSGTIFRLAAPPRLSVRRMDGQVEISWTSFIGGRYRVEVATALTGSTWLPISSELEAIGTATSFRVPVASTFQFFRVSVSP